MWNGDESVHQSAIGRQHQQRPTRIECGLSASASRCRPTTGIISQGLHASDVAYAHRLGDIGRGLHASARRYKPWQTRIG
ncbi:hypothetical protein H5410_049336 [Solanum commersonii]|uniref:Uncharacterized protein n=1 Tax=Solanum commersonii TaxID=4109 RepID=A0A9J5WTW1_SOLCO|nr:hypothetical protein H5410_049336 [Solanum commersonii]